NAKHVIDAQKELKELFALGVAQATVQISRADIPNVLPKIPRREMRCELPQIGGLARVDFLSSGEVVSLSFHAGSLQHIRNRHNHAARPSGGRCWDSRAAFTNSRVLHKSGARSLQPAL